MAKDKETTAQQEAASPAASASQATAPEVSPSGIPQPRPCPQDCRQCGINQQIFCTTKMLFDLSRRQQILEAAVGEMAKTLADIQEQMREKEQNDELSIPFSEG